MPRRHQPPKSQGRRLRRLVLPAVLLVGAVPAAVADTLTVTDCLDSVPGGTPGQLRFLMNAATAGDTILIPPTCPAIYITGSSGDDANVSGDLDITKNLTIQGAGAGMTLIGIGDPFTERVFHVQPGVSANINDLTVANAAYYFDGTAFYNAGTLQLLRVTVSNNTSLSSNAGGIYNDTTGQLFVVDSTLIGNHAGTGSGAAIHNKGTANVIHSSIVQNQAGSSGGIHNTGSLFLADTTVSGNSASNGLGGGISNISDGPPATTVMTGTTVSGNTARYAAGGIFNTGALTATNSTISGNTVTDAGGGGGILNQDQTVPVSMTLTRVTVTGNSSTFASAINNSGGGGGGISGLVEGTIVTGSCLGGGVTSSNGHNLDAGHVCFVPPTATDIQDTDPKLEPLHDNGGPTLTHLPMSDSPAIDAGGATCPVATDQRGVARPKGLQCDIGAVEWYDLIFQDGFESGNTSAWSFNSNDGGDLSVTPGAAQHGTAFGLQAVVDDTAGIYVEDRPPLGESRYRARFYFDPHDYDPGESQGHFRTRIFIMFDDAGTRRLSAIVLKRQGGSYSIMQRCRRDDDSQYDSGFFPLAGNPHWILAEWRRATDGGSADGVCALTVDGTALSNLTDVQNNVSTLGMVRLGTMNVKGGASGTPFFDEFVSKRIGAIPPLP